MPGGGAPPSIVAWLRVRAPSVDSGGGGRQIRCPPPEVSIHARLRTAWVYRFGAGVRDVLDANDAAASPGRDREQRRVHRLWISRRHQACAAAPSFAAADE